MSSINTLDIESIVQQIDRVIGEMTALRSQLAFMNAPVRRDRSVREADYFGMWSDREDLRGMSSREWLERLRAQQWARP